MSDLSPARYAVRYLSYLVIDTESWLFRSYILFSDYLIILHLESETGRRESLDKSVTSITIRGSSIKFTSSSSVVKKNLSPELRAECNRMLIFFKHPLQSGKEHWDDSTITFYRPIVFTTVTVWTATVLSVGVNNNLKSKLKPHQRDHVLLYFCHIYFSCTILLCCSAFLYIHTFFIQSNTRLFCIFRRGLFYIIFIKKYWWEKRNKIENALDR